MPPTRARTSQEANTTYARPISQSATCPFRSLTSHRSMLATSVRQWQEQPKKGRRLVTRASALLHLCTCVPGARQTCMGACTSCTSPLFFPNPTRCMDGVVLTNRVSLERLCRRGGKDWVASELRHLPLVLCIPHPLRLHALGVRT